MNSYFGFRDVFFEELSSYSDGNPIISGYEVAGKGALCAHA